MIRRSLILWVAIAAAVSVALFVVKYEVKSLEEQYAHLNREILRTREAIHVLRAEWSYLNRPDQLAEMAQRHLDLQPLLAPQMGELASLPARKPGMTPPAPGPDAVADGVTGGGIAELIARSLDDEPAKPAVIPIPSAKPPYVPAMTPVLTSTKVAP